MSIFIGNNTRIENSIIGTNKYKNKKCVYKDMTFDSLKEMQYYKKLELLQNCGRISDLKRQVEFVLIETFKLDDETYRKTKYIADFTYYDDKGNYHVVDTKGFKTKEYLLKKKLMAWKYGIKIEEM